MIPDDRETSGPAGAEVEFALVLARMIESVKNDPKDLRQAIYELARYKLQDQFGHGDAANVRRTQQALEHAIRGVEFFAAKHDRLPMPAPQPSPAQLIDPKTPATMAPVTIEPADLVVPASQVPQPQARRAPEPRRPATPPGPPTPHRRPSWAFQRRVLALTMILVAGLIGFQQRVRVADFLHDFLHDLARSNGQVAVSPAPTPASSEPASSAQTAPAAPKPAEIKPPPLLPTDYGVYAVSDDKLFELHQVPGRPPDMRIAISAAIRTPSQTLLPNGQPRFIVFRRDLPPSSNDQPAVRVIARVARQFTPGTNGRIDTDADQTWIMRNIAFAFRSSPMQDHPDMYAIHSEDPSAVLTPGRYALVFSGAAFDFSVAGDVVDPNQCLEQIAGLNGTFYSPCKHP